jgi:hypothetical protein
VPGDRNKAVSKNTNDTSLSAAKLSLGQKAARKPYNYVIVDYMDVVDGQEENYLKAEAVWQKIHQAWSEQGRILGWGLAKARKNKLGVEFITWKLVHSREDVAGLYNMDEIKTLVSEDDFKTLQELTGSSRSISGSEVLALFPPFFRVIFLDGIAGIVMPCFFCIHKYSSSFSYLHLDPIA